MTRITRERGSLKKDDRIDALAMAVAYWCEAMARDTAKAAEEVHLEWLEKMIEDEEEAWFGGKPNASNWLRRPS